MHTAFSLQRAMFEIRIDGVPSEREALFEGRPDERLGIVISSPLGAAGASLMIQLAITAYFDSPERSRRSAPHYAEIYAFHIGGRHGNLGSLDIWPQRKEVFIAGSGADTLSAINSHGITHLLVPDGAPQEITHRYKEPEAARDRVRRCFAYGSTGRVADADILIATSSDVPLEDLDDMLDPHVNFEKMSGFPAPDDPVARVDGAVWLAGLQSRIDEVTPQDYEDARRARRALTQDGRFAQSFRRIDIDTALQRLGPNDGPQG